MERKNMPQKYRVEEQKPHFLRIFKAACKSAVNEIRESDEYKSHLEAFMDTKEFKQLTERNEECLSNIDEYLDMVQQLVERAQKDNENTDLYWTLWNIIHSGSLQEVYDISYHISRLDELDSDSLTLENWRERVKDNYISELDKGIAETQEQYADRKMKLQYSHWLSSKQEDAFNCLVYSITINTVEDAEEAIRNGLNYKELVINND